MSAISCRRTLFKITANVPYRSQKTSVDSKDTRCLIWPHIWCYEVAAWCFILPRQLNFHAHESAVCFSRWARRRGLSRCLFSDGESGCALVILVPSWYVCLSQLTFATPTSLRLLRTKQRPNLLNEQVPRWCTELCGMDSSCELSSLHK